MYRKAAASRLTLPQDANIIEVPMKTIKWYTASASIITAVFLLSAFGGNRFPFFLDIYYHLNVMRGFDSAGGVVNWAFWELAPAGQPLIYPPLFHLLMLVPFKLGAGILWIAKFSSIVPAVLLIAATGFVSARMLSAKSSFFAVLALCIPYSFFLKMTITVPVAISLLFMMLAFYALEKRRIAACSIFLCLVFYTHPAMPWMAFLAFAIYAAFQKQARADVLKCLIFAAALSIPQIVNTFMNTGSIAGPLGIPMPEGRMYEIYPVIYLLAVAGAAKIGSVRGVQGKKIRSFAFSLLIAFLPLAVNYRFRYISAEGLFPVLLLAGAGLEYIYDRLKTLIPAGGRGKASGIIYAAIFPVVFMVFSPTLSSYVPLEPPYDNYEFSAHISDSTITNLVPRLKPRIRPFEISLADDMAMDWARIISANTSADDIICSNYAFTGGMISALTGRANSARTYFEVKEPPIPISEFGSAKAVVWTREDNGKFSSDINECILKFGYTVIHMDGGGAILVKQSGAKAVPVKPVVSTPIALSLLFAAMAAAFWGIAKP